MDKRNGNFELRINDSILYSNTANQGSGGGAIYINVYRNSYQVQYHFGTNFDLQVNNTLVYNNQAYRGDGGAIYLYNNYYRYISNF